MQRLCACRTLAKADMKRRIIKNTLQAVPDLLQCSHRLQVSILRYDGNTPIAHLYQYRFGCLEILSASCGVHYQSQSLCSLADSLSCHVLLEIINCFATQLSTALHTEKYHKAAHALTRMQRHQQCKYLAVIPTCAVPKLLKECQEVHKSAS